MSRPDRPRPRLSRDRSRACLPARCLPARLPLDRRCLLLVALALVACVPQAERTASSHFREVARHRESVEPPELDGTLDTYVAFAMRQSPALEASLARWEAATLRVRGKRRWPRPQVSYMALVRPVETRVGPQRQRVGARIPIAWPGQLRSGAEGAAALADAEAERFAAEVVKLRARIAEVYWPLWLVERRADALDAELALLETLAESLRARLETGTTPLAQAQLVELRRARVADARAALEPARRRLEAGLRATLGIDAATDLPITDDPPEVRAPTWDVDALRALAATRPEVRVHEALALASEANERNAAARRHPDLALGVEWMETGPARMPNVRGDGDDAWMIGVTVGVPVDLGAMRDEQRAARADARGHRADGRALALGAEAELDAALAELEDARRRIGLHESALLPSAEAAWESMLVAFASARASLADVLLASRELVELRFGLDEARATFARAYARLEAAIGRPLAEVSR